MSREKITFNPSSATSQPMTSRLSGQVCSPAGPSRGDWAYSSRQLTMAAAAPSPKRAVATRLLFERSWWRKVSAQSSTTSSSTRDCGLARAMDAARARPSTPPAQPRPNTGVRSTSARKSRWRITRASSPGVAMPVEQTVTMESISLASKPGLIQGGLRPPRPATGWRFPGRCRCVRRSCAGSRYHSIGTQEWRLSMSAFE